MKKFFLSLAVFVMALCANAQTNQYFWYNGHLMLGSQVSSVDSITFGEEETDSIMLYLPRTVTKVVYDTIYQVFHDTIYKNENEINADYQCENSIASGDCSRSGSNVTWSLCEDSVIIFEGSGEMEGYANFTAPWYSHISDFHTAILKEGIENLGDFTLVGPNLKTLILPQTLKKIEGLACHGANKLTSVNFPDSLEVIGERSFLDCAFESITIPASVHTIGGGAFQGCTKLKTVYLQSSTPAGAGYDIFINVYDAIIFVPRGSLQAYQNAYGWSEHASQMREYDYSPSKPETPTIIHDTIYITIHETVCPNDVPEGALTGEFSVSPTKKVRFSKGNLQCVTADTTWRFADNQWDMLGERNMNAGVWGDTIDLFGWSSNNTYYGMSTSSNDNTYEGAFVDWGFLMNSTWYTLSGLEWNYLLHTRNNHENLIAVGTVNGVNGCIILPDTWVQPQGVTFIPGVADDQNVEAFSTINTYTLAEWKIMEMAGAVFMPAASLRRGSEYDTNLHQAIGRYWGRTRTYGETGQAHSFGFESNNIASSYDVPHYGFSVRLVQDIE